MRRFLSRVLSRATAVGAVVAALAGFAPASRALDLPRDTREVAAIKTLIQRQIEAFLRDDAEGAFSLASPRIRGIFGTADNFLAMVRSGYGAVYRTRHLSFRDLVVISGNLIQPVVVIGPDGVSVTALYIIERQTDGSWRIGGCVLVPEPDETT
ncbi:MAG: DUF4864 domain-containing protein [Alphaproteobacteria bacterium]|nr:DUF4864 domain-containing protein [Alphaproteobacteria bacterium]